jgi:hypothetical protein
MDSLGSIALGVRPDVQELTVGRRHFVLPENPLSTHEPEDTDRGRGEKAAA